MVYPASVGPKASAEAATAPDLAPLSGVREISVRRFLSGQREIPPNLAAWLEGLVAHMAAYPELPDKLGKAAAG